MTKKLAKEYIDRYKEEMYSMLRYRMWFGEGETWVIISSQVIAGAKFKKSV